MKKDIIIKMNLKLQNKMMNLLKQQKDIKKILIIRKKIIYMKREIILSQIKLIMIMKLQII